MFMENLRLQASSFAPDVDQLIHVITYLSGFWFLIAEGAFFYFVFKFRRKPNKPAQYITGEKKEEKRWIHIPHNLILLCDVVIIVMAIKVWYTIKQTLPTPDATIRIIGQQWTWRFVDPGLDGQLGTPDDIETVDELHVVVDKTYQFKLESIDVLHSFAVPVFRLKQDAVPGRIITGWFKPTVKGEYNVLCSQICGTGHGLMKAKIVVETAEEHEAWLKTQKAMSASTN